MGTEERGRELTDLDKVTLCERLCVVSAFAGVLLHCMCISQSKDARWNIFFVVGSRVGDNNWNDNGCTTNRLL